MSTGTTIRDLRKQHRLSQTELAKAVHVSQATVTARSILEIDISTFLAVLCAECVQIK